MERKAYIPPEVIEPLTEENLEARRKTLEWLISKSKQNNNPLKFFVFLESKDVISVGIKDSNFGMWLFDATSKTSVQALAEEGLNLVENETDMILSQSNASIWSITRRLPAFIRKYYPEVSRVVPEKELRLPPKRVPKAA